MHVEMHPSMKVLLLPWEKTYDGKLQLFMYLNNHNTSNTKKACDIANNMARDLLDLESKHIKEWVTDGCLGVFWQDKVSSF